METLLKSSLFNFFGDVTSITYSRSDAAAIMFFYGDYLCEVSPHIDYECTFSNEDTPLDGFFASLLSKDGAQKHYKLTSAADGRTIVEQRFTAWSALPSPIPPLMHTDRASSFAALSGSCIELHGVGTLFLGANYSGKTSLTVGLCDRGARFVSDSTCYFSLTERVVLNASWPLGFRRVTLEHYEDRLASVPTMETVSPVTGRVVLANPASVIKHVARDPVALRRVVLLQPKEDIRSPELFSIEMPTAMPHFSGALAANVMEQLPPKLDVLVYAPDTPTHTLASFLERKVNRG